MFWCVSYQLGAFGTVRMPYKTRDKTCRTCKSSGHEVASEFFATNAPNPPHWNLNSCFGVFRTISDHFVSLQNSGQNGPNVLKFVPRSHVRIFRDKPTRSTLLVPKLMFWCVSYRLRAFGTMKLPYETQGKMFRTSAKVRATMLHRIISQRTHPIRPIGP